MARCLRLAALAAKSDVPVVLLGETGTGKTLLAHAIHNSSARAAQAFVSFNASAMSDTLLESQLFGHERGAFTGAQQAVKGKFELANSGTLFLDEISEMSPLAQVKILRVLEYGEFERLGSERMLKCDVRIICATNCSLRERVSRGKVSRGSLPSPQRAHFVDSATARKTGRIARVDCRRIERQPPFVKEKRSRRSIPRPWKGSPLIRGREICAN